MKKNIWSLIAAVFALNPLSAILVVNEPSIIVYETPEESGHIEDIIRYGTKVEVIDSLGSWVQISTIGGCPGWILSTRLLDVEQDPEISADGYVGFRGAYVYNEPDTEWGPFLSLPFETPVKVIEELPQQHDRWLLIELQDGRQGYMQRSQMYFSPQQLSISEMVDFAGNFLGTKYLWGGTTSFGYDCSGFVQMLYRQMGIQLPRNSSWQAEDPRFQEVDLQEARAGDLIFFKNRFGRVGHVGLVINQNEFMHAFPLSQSWICIMPLNDERISNGYFYYGVIVKRFVGQK